MKASPLSELLLLRRDGWTDPAHPGGANKHHRLYELIKTEILAGKLAGGTKLPPSRQLARELGLSRNTVVYAYEQLLAEEYVVATVGSGTFVNKLVRPLAPRPAPVADPATPAAPAMLSQRARKILRAPGASPQQWGAFVPGVPDVTLFPHSTWRRLLARHWHRPAPQNLSYSTVAGHPALRKAVAQHLHMTRSVRCTPEQIVITTGIHQAVDLATRLLADVGAQAWVEDPSYWGLRNVLMANGLQVHPVPVDAQGMAPDPDLLARAGGPRFIFATPSHQYPLGIVMSLQRRLMLLDYIGRNNCWLVEDDYDSEYRFGGDPLASMQGLDSHGRVLYTGTFSKTLFPGLRTGYIVLPPGLVDAAATLLSELYREGQLIQQAVLADFISEGHYAAHIRRTRQSYAERQAAMREAIALELGADWPVLTQGAMGLHLVLGLPADCDDVALAADLLRECIFVKPLSRYYLDPTRAQPGLLMGFACVDVAQIRAGVATLAQVIRRQLPGAVAPEHGRASTRPAPDGPGIKGSRVQEWTR